MAINVRFSESELNELRAQAEREHRSMDAVTRIAVREYIQRHRELDEVRAIAARGAERYAGALERLGDL